MSYPFNEAGIVPYCTSGRCVLHAAEPIIPGVRLNTNMGHLALLYTIIRRRDTPNGAMGHPSSYPLYSEAGVTKEVHSFLETVTISSTRE